MNTNFKSCFCLDTNLSIYWVWNFSFSFRYSIRAYCQESSNANFVTLYKYFRKIQEIDWKPNVFWMICFNCFGGFWLYPAYYVNICRNVIIQLLKNCKTNFKRYFFRDKYWTKLCLNFFLLLHSIRTHCDKSKDANLIYYIIVARGLRNVKKLQNFRMQCSVYFWLREKFKSLIFAFFHHFTPLWLNVWRLTTPLPSYLSFTLTHIYRNLKYWYYWLICQ